MEVQEVLTRGADVPVGLGHLFGVPLRLDHRGTGRRPAEAADGGLLGIAPVGPAVPDAVPEDMHQPMPAVRELALDRIRPAVLEVVAGVGGKSQTSQRGQAHQARGQACHRGG